MTRRRRRPHRVRKKGLKIKKRCVWMSLCVFCEKGTFRRFALTLARDFSRQNFNRIDSNSFFFFFFVLSRRKFKFKWRKAQRGGFYWSVTKVKSNLLWKRVWNFFMENLGKIPDDFLRWKTISGFEFEGFLRFLVFLLVRWLKMGF